MIERIFSLDERHFCMTELSTFTARGIAVDCIMQELSQGKATSFPGAIWRLSQNKKFF
jgi:hypothetical protein